MDIASTLKRLLKPVVPQQLLGRYHRLRRLRYIDQLNPGWDESRRTILAINHHCDQDYEAIRRVNQRFNFVEVIARTLFQGSSHYFTDEVEFIRAAYEDEPEENLRRYRRESQLIFDRLYGRYPIDLILVPNDNYFFIRELIDIARVQGIPTVVLDKEGIITPHSFHSESKRARDFTPVIADHIFVWSHRQRLFWMGKGVAEDRITVVGQPRSDLLFLPPGDRLARYFDIERPLVTVFSYMDTAYLPLEHIARTKSSWRDMKSETNAIIGDLADVHPDHNFVIKCHPLQPDLEAIRLKYERANLRVLGGSALGNELLLRSDLIIAFQTTALIEAMLVGKSAIYTAWDPQIRDLQDYLLPFHEASGIIVADSADKLRTVAGRYLSGQKDDFVFSEKELEARREFVHQYLFQPDGHASERLLNEIERFLS